MTAMNVSLTPELVKIIKKRVKSGLYNNASEYIREAIRQKENLDKKEKPYSGGYTVSELKALLAEGIKDVEEGNLIEIKDINKYFDKVLNDTI
jgi:antitoxin ParD1/3/4